MIAYSKTHLDNLAIVHEAKKWHHNTLITDQKYQEIITNHKHPFYSPNFFVRIGLFVFTLICASAANGLIMAMTGIIDNNGETGIAIRLFVHGSLMLFALEFLIKEKNIFKSGIDDALLYMILGYFITGISFIFSSYELDEINSLLLISIVTLPILIAATIRYSDRMVAASVFICMLFIIFLVMNKISESTKLFLPFVAMITASITYFLSIKYRKKDSLRYWDNSLWIIEILSLLLFYLAGNYYIVRTLTEELIGIYINEGEDIPMAYFFYAFTALIPLVYIFIGLKNKNKILLRTGLLLIAASVITFKYYFSLGHHEITMTIGGSIMLALAWFSINYLKTPKHGITYTKDTDENILGNFDSETLVLAQTFGGTHHVQGDNNPEMGGGKFGGGGADSSF